MRQDCEASKGVMAAPRRGGSNMECENTMHATYPFLFEDESMLFNDSKIK